MCSVRPGPLEQAEQPLGSSTVCFAIPGILSTPFELNLEQMNAPLERLAQRHAGRFSRAEKSSDNKERWVSKV